MHNIHNKIMLSFEGNITFTQNVEMTDITIIISDLTFNLEIQLD